MITKRQAELIPSVSSQKARDKHKTNIERWKMYARRMQKNPFMKKYIVREGNNKCSWCEGYLNKYVLHHTDYDHLCFYEVCIEFPNPTEKRPNRRVKVPDCETCFYTNRTAFQECAKRVKPVHVFCNKEIYDHSPL
ncbi:hypothetical protein MK805_15515 [Shimazuella sp. AN120528]|uniref:hypothetical protein n=1 Tax=Shimazuella soli TaxID=1892854 RepID=UPI001F1014A8|nr:hypothetical protein [Shimazuella soli]MCH5586351.1 hypothetical protein [Shimazuella soli]